MEPITIPAISPPFRVPSVPGFGFLVGAGAVGDLVIIGAGAVGAGAIGAGAVGAGAIGAGAIGALVVSSSIIEQVPPMHTLNLIPTMGFK